MSKKFFSSLLVACVAAIAAYYFPKYFDGEAKALKLIVASVVSLQPELKDPINELKILFDGEALQSPYVSTLELVNVGTKDIPAMDFQSPIEIQLPKQIKLIKAELIGTEPKDIRVEISKENNTLKIQPLLLNSLDKLTFSLVTAGGQPTFVPYARITGVKSINLEKNVKAKKQTSILYAITFFVLSILAIFALNYLIDIFTFKKPLSVDWKIAVILMLISLLMAGIATVILFQSLGLEASRLNMIIYILITTVICAWIIVDPYKNFKFKIFTKSNINEEKSE